VTNLPPSCAAYPEILEPQTPGNLSACPGLYRDCFIDLNLRIKRVTAFIWSIITISVRTAHIRIVKNVPRKFITVFSRARHWSVSSSNRIRPTAFHPTSLRSIAMFLLVLLLLRFSSCPVTFFYTFSSLPYLSHVLFNISSFI
jgi:hypothetical protein